MIAFVATLTVSAFADTNSTERWTVSLGGAGATTTVSNGTTGVGADIGVGYLTKVLLPLEVGVRQGVTYSNDDVILNSRVYGDFTVLSVFNKRVDLFVGGNVGATYGGSDVDWTIAPEAGLRWWLKRDVGVVARAEVPFNLEGWDYQNTVRYFLGFQVKF